MSDETEKPQEAGDHGHDHDHEGHDHDGEALEPIDLGPSLVAARTGLRSQVQKLVDDLPEAQIYIPLAEDLPEAPEGEQIALDGELTFRPHMILNSDHSVFAVGYSDPELVEEMQKALGWQTAGEDLKFICVPAHVIFDLAQMRLEGEDVTGIVFNPGTDEELVLQRDEAASLIQGTAIPLVGYVADLPPSAEEETEIVQGAAAPPQELLDALEAAVAKLPDLVKTEVQTTFNPERDREPHLTLTFTVIGRDGLDRQAIADEAMLEAAPHLPAPGYADIVFRDAPN